MVRDAVLTTINIVVEAVALTASVTETVIP
jgi:hypothetical protein